MSTIIAKDAFGSSHTTLNKLLSQKHGAVLVLFWDSLNTPLVFARMVRALSPIGESMPIYTVDTKPDYMSVHSLMHPHGVDITAKCRCTESSYVPADGRMPGTAWHSPSPGGGVVHLFNNMLPVLIIDGTVIEITTTATMSVQSFTREVMAVFTKTIRSSRGRRGGRTPIS